MKVKISPYVLRAIATWGMTDDFDSNDDWELAKDLEKRMSEKFYNKNRLVSGPPVVMDFEERALKLLLPRIRQINREEQNREIERWIPTLQYTLKTGVTHTTINKRSEFAKIKEAAEKVVTLTAKECVDVILSNYPTMPRRYRPKIFFDWNTSRVSSWGGYNPKDRGSKYGLYGGISLAMTCYINRTGRAVKPGFVEYSHIQKDPVMGGFQTDNWKLQLMALTCHEIVHAMQYYYFYEITEKSETDYDVAHGKGFQKMYTLVREQVCNPRLKAAGIKVGKI